MCCSQMLGNDQFDTLAELAHSQSLFDLLYAARAMPAGEEAMTTEIAQEEDSSAINWYRELTPVEKRTFWACFGGWALDAMDVQIFSFAIPAIIIAFAITNADAGLIGTVTLLTSAFGGWFACALADRFGRVRTLQITILWFAFFTLLCGFAQNYTQLLVFGSVQNLSHFRLAERHPALAHAVMAPLICWSFSNSMFRYLLVDHAVPAMWRSLAAARLSAD